MSESTSIDKLSIEITSNASKAADGIEELAIALGDLKKSGSVGTAVKNLKELSDAMGKLSSVSSNAQKLKDLAVATSQLSQVKSFGSLISNLKKLPEVTASLRKLQVQKDLGSKLQKIADAAKPLGNIRTGGLSTMVRSLSKIGEVTENLKPEVINKFADRIRVLVEKLSPLSTKLTTIQVGLRGLNTSARSAGSGVKNLESKVNTTTLNLANLITVIRGVVSALMPLVRLMSDTISQALEWDGVAARFGRGFGDQAEEVYAWVKRLNEEMGINTQQFMQYSSVFATMLQGFGVGLEDSSKMALGYTELVYDIWAGYNDIYKNFSDAADAVKSAIAGEVEPIRRAGFTIVESTLEQTAANHGLEISLEKATEAQKSYLRYLTLVDQAHAQNLVGTYARELNTAEGMMRTFSQQLKSLAQAFGSVFLPILVKVMPWLQAFVELLAEGIVYLAGLFGIEIQPVDFSEYSGGITAIEGVGNAADDATGSLDDTSDAIDKTTNALKDLKKATIGIDELNVISPPSSSSGSGSGGSGSGGSGSGGAGGGLGAFEDLDVDSLWDESIFDQVQSKVDELRQKLKDFYDEWETELKIIGGLLAALGMAKMLEHLGQALGLGDKFLGVMKTISKLAVTGIVIVLQYTLMTEFFDKFIDGEGFKNYIAALFVGAIGTGILYSMWGPAGLVIGLGVTAAASLKAVIENGGITNTESAVVALTGLASAAGAVGIAVKNLAPILANSNLGAFFALLKEGNGFLPTLSAAFPKLSGAISGAASTAGTFLAGISAPVWAAIAAAIAALIGTIVFLKENWDAVTAAVKRFFNENIVPKLEKIKESFAKMREALGPVGDAIAKAWEWLKKFLAEVDIFGAIGKIFEGIGFVVVEVLGGAIAGAFQAAMGIIEGFVQVITGLVEIVGGVVEAIVKLFTGDLSGAWEACKKIGQGIADVFIGLYDMTIGAVIDFVDGVISWFVDLWDELVGHSIVPDTIDGIVECFTGLPGKVLGKVEKFVGDIIGKFKDFGTKIVEKIRSGWQSVENWWDKNVNLSEKISVGVKLAKEGWSTVKGWIGKIPGVSQTVSLVKKGWSTVKGWVGSMPTLSQAISLAKNKWTSVKKWIGNIPAVSQAVSLAKKGWSSVKKWVGSIPTLNANIKLVKSGWSSVKKWLGNLDFKLNFKLPKIKVNWGSKTVAGFTIKYPSGFSTYAKGGFPDMGELFVAREAGPELVGKMGSRTTVANNQQIVEGISEGVYRAVVAAMRQSESGGSQNVNVYLDGRQITSSVERHQRERGANLMGREVYAY